MNNRQLLWIVGALVVGLVLGMLIGAAAGSDLPVIGTVADEDDSEDTAQADTEMNYYLVDLETAREWLAETYPDVEDDTDAVTTNVSALADEDDIGAAAREKEAELIVMLAWTQAALHGVDEVSGMDDLGDIESVADAAEKLNLPKDRTIVACLALDDDPWATDPDYKAAVQLYLEVPEDEAKNIPADWKTTEPKGTTDLFWTPLLCDPELK